MRSRTVDDKETSIVSPVDAKIASLGTLTPKSEFQVKGQMYQLLDLLGDRESPKTWTAIDNPKPAQPATPKYTRLLILQI